MSHARTAKPTALAISLKEIRDYLGLDDASENEILTRCVREATDVIEERFSIAVMSQTWKLSMRSWFDSRYWRAGYCAFQIPPRPPFGSVSSIAYIDQNGDSQTWTESSSGYQINTVGDRIYIKPAYNVEWPELRESDFDAVVVTHTCGASSQDNVDHNVKWAIKSAVEHRYEYGCLPDEDWWSKIGSLMVGQEVYA